jgi:preprotein translocase subunit SecB
MAEAQTDQPLVINTQYIRDLSFENPNAPEIYSALAEHSPELNVNIDVATAQVHKRTFEVVLTIRVQATVAEKVAFLIELDYAGLVTLGDSVAESEAERLLVIETPRYLFPFARNILASVTGEGGFPPLVVNPIDFEQFYRRHKDGEASTGAAENAGDDGEAAVSEA